MNSNKIQFIFENKLIELKNPDPNPWFPPKLREIISAPFETHQSTDSETNSSLPTPSSPIAFATSNSTPGDTPSNPPFAQEYAKPPYIDNLVKGIVDYVMNRYKTRMEEINTTGTGTSFQAGSGEGYMTPNAFKKKRKKK